MSLSSILISLVAGGVFWLYWRGLARSKMSLKASRIILLIALPVIGILPFLSFAPMREMTMQFLPEVSVIEQSTKWLPKGNVGLQFSIDMVIVGGAIIQLAFFLTTIVRTRRWSKIGERTTRERREVVVHPSIPAPFTFLRTVFTPPIPEEDAHCILDHEIAHINRLHQWDSTLMLLVRMLAWWNPFVHLLSGELRLVHEKEADLDVVASRDINLYAEQLVRYAVHGGFVHVHHYSLTRQIVERMKNLQSTNRSSFSWTLMTLLFVMTLAGGVAFAQESSTHMIVEVDQPPVLEGCEDGDMACFQSTLISHIAQNLTIPKGLDFGDQNPRFFVKFEIDEEGNVENMQTLRSPCSGSDDADMASDCNQVEDAIRKALETLPIVKAAMKDGAFVKVQYTIPVLVALE